MTSKVVWSAFALILSSIFAPTEAILPAYQRGNEIEDRVVQQTKNLVSPKVKLKSQEKIARFHSKTLENKTLFGKTSPSVFQTPSLHPSTSASTPEHPTTSTGSFIDFVLLFLSSLKNQWKEYLELLFPTTPHPLNKPTTSPENFIDFVLILLSSFINKWKECLELLFPFDDTPTQPPLFEDFQDFVLMFLSSLKNQWKSFLELLFDTPTQPPLSSESPSSLQPVSSKPSFIAPNLPTQESNHPSSSALPSTTPNPSNEVSNHTFKWKIATDDIDGVFETKDQIALSFQDYLDHRIRCKGEEAEIKHVKLVRDQEFNEVYVKGVCFGLRKSCIINLSEDDCNDNSIIDDFVSQRMLDISSSFDYEIELSVSFDFDKDNINVVSDFLSELIEGVSGRRRVVSSSNKPEPPQVNNEGIITITRDGANNQFKNEAIFQQNVIESEELIFLSTEKFSSSDFNSFDDTTTVGSYYGTPKSKCGRKCVEEKFTVENIFAFYDVNFNTSIDVCFWGDINCIDGSVTQIFFRKY